MPRVSVVLAAAGTGVRMGGVDKLFLPLGDKTMLQHCLARMQEAERVREIVIVGRASLLPAITNIARSTPLEVKVVPGGDSRFESVRCGLNAVSDTADFVAIHDAARPLVTRELIDRVIDAAQAHGAAIPALPVADTIKEAVGERPSERVGATLRRKDLRKVQTPQVFSHRLLVEAYRSLGSSPDGALTDDASIVEAYGHPVHLVPGDERNFKITTWEDYEMATALADRTPLAHRVGVGYDSHRLTAGRPLYLGGVQIPSPVGLEGHSDADAVLHAVCDALLGSVGLGDIGMHFPVGDERWRDIRSSKLLELVAAMVAESGYLPGNIDVTVVAERPRLAPFITEMRGCIADAAGICPKAVSVKAKTNESMGSLGRGEGIAALAVCTVFGVCDAPKMRNLRDG